MYPLVGDEQHHSHQFLLGKSRKAYEAQVEVITGLEKNKSFIQHPTAPSSRCVSLPISHLGRLDGTGPFTGRACLQTQFTPNKASPRTPRLLIAAPSQRGASEWKIECRHRCAANEWFSEGPFPYFGREPHP